MIKPNELRIGNLVDDRHGCLLIVSETTSQVVWGNLVDGGIPVARKFDILEPVPLTEDWLRRCGFEVTNTDAGDRFVWMELQCDDFSIKYERENPSYFTGPLVPKEPIQSLDLVGNGGFDYLGHMDMKNKINHVHQLQNLYFALTGKELEINKSL